MKFVPFRLSLSGISSAGNVTLLAAIAFLFEGSSLGAMQAISRVSET